MRLPPDGCLWAPLARVTVGFIGNRDWPWDEVVILAKRTHVAGGRDIKDFKLCIEETRGERWAQIEERHAREYPEDAHGPSLARLFEEDFGMFLEYAKEVYAEVVARGTGQIIGDLLGRVLIT